MELIQEKCRWRLLWVGTLLMLLIVSSGHAESDPEKRFVGSQACQECHETEYENYSSYAKKATSYESVTVMAKGLTEAEQRECFACHTTGYGQPGGFVSAATTPHLKDAGCEVCHGPGSIHIDSEDPEDIAYDISIEVCKSCHNSDRVASFNYKPLLFGGAH
jgi:hypothetical protein